MICKNNSYSWQTAILSSPETQGWPLSYFMALQSLEWFLNLWASMSSQLRPSHPETVPLTALIFFHWRSSSALSLVSLKRLVFRPSDILMPYWNAALKGKKRGVEGRRHQRLQRSTKVFPEDLWAENWFRNVSARLRPLTTPHPSPHSWLYLVPRLTWAKPPCCSYTRYIPPGCQSPSGLKDLSCYPVAGQNWGGGRGRERRVVSEMKF